MTSKGRYRLYAAGLLWLGALLLLAACTGQPGKPPPAAFQQTGWASYYAPQLNGRLTASGERYDRQRLTAAHRDLPFGTIVEVASLANGRTVRVRINDRGPFVHGRIIDLSHAAAEQLKMVKTGVVKVTLRVVAR
jgi:rare lipoprotein A